MSKILAIFGATGQQGSSVLQYVLRDPELSQEFKIRAITRDATVCLFLLTRDHSSYMYYIGKSPTNNRKSEKSKALAAKGIEVTQADVSNRASLESALAGVHTLFSMTTPSFGPDALETEFHHAKTIADVAVEQGAQYIIFSTLPAVAEISGGKYTAVTPFDAKAKAEKYIRGLPIKSAFFSGGFFMENFASQPWLSPQKGVDGSYVLARPLSSKTRFPYLDAVGDVGKFVGAILAEPGKYEGKTFCAAAGLYSLDEIVAILSKATGKKVVYEQISAEEFKKGMPFMGELFEDAFAFQEEYGYFGPGTEKLVAWAAGNARGRLTTLEEYFVAHPLQLE